MLSYLPLKLYFLIFIEQELSILKISLLIYNWAGQYKTKLFNYIYEQVSIN